MSGTSLDGISAAVVRFAEEGDGSLKHLTSELLAYDVVEYTPEQRARLARALEGASAEEYCRINADLGEWLARAAINVIAQSGVARKDVAAIASHGQTIWHVPGHSTWQTGEAAVIAERTGLPVISDFRVRDVAAEGQGAPLVPIADALLFSAPRSWRALQNFGGIGNVTIVPPGGELAGVRAFDTGPGVVIIDGVTRLLEPSLRFDRDGEIANRGEAIGGVVEAALQEPYFRAPPPKSTGRELFNAAYIARFIGECRAQRENATTADVVATAVQFTAASVADSFSRFVPEPVTELLVSGGGSRNPVLMRELARRLGEVQVKRFDDEFFDAEAKEAVAFALLGWLHLEGRPGNVPGATGARGPRVLGKLTPA